MINISELNKRINIEVFNGEGRDKEGYPIEDWPPYHTCWAKRTKPNNKTLKGSEYTLNNSEWADNIIAFVVRKSSKIEPLLYDIKATKNYRVNYKGVMHDIKYIGENPKEANFVDIICLCIG